MHSSASGHLDIPALPTNAAKAHFFPELHPHSLLFIGQLCDPGCTATFHADTVTIDHQHKPILTGLRDPHTKLWHIPIQVKSPPTHFANYTIHHPKHSADLGAFAHAALFSPAIPTLLQALRRNFLLDIPGLNAHTLHTNPPTSIPMLKGHLDQVRQGLQPTAHRSQPPHPPGDLTLPSDPDLQPPGEPPTHHCYAATINPTTPTNTIYTDQTGRFPITTSRGHTQLFLLYDYDSNSIHVAPMRTKNAADILEAFQSIHKILVNAGLRPKLQRLDNECSNILLDFMATNSIQPQLVPPGVHRANAAERAIRTFKNHFISGLCSTDPNFPLHLWDLLLPQAQLTLNLLRGSRINPNLSAQAQVFGQFSYNATPLAPPGSHILIHDKPAHRQSWAPHALDAWYLGPALLHYRCHRAWVWSTRHERISDTVTWLPHHVTFPQADPIDLIQQHLRNIHTILTAPSTNTNNPLHLAPNQLDAINTLTTILGHSAPPHSTPRPADTPVPEVASPLRVPTLLPDSPPTPATPPAQRRNSSRRRWRIVRWLITCRS